MKFGSRECANIVFRAKQETKIGSETFHVGQPVLYIDTATTTSIEQASTTVYAQGGRGNTRLMAWEGEKTMTFSVTDALLSPIGLSVLIGAGLFKGAAGVTDKVHYHMTTNAPITEGKDTDTNYYIDLGDVLAEFGTTAYTGTIAKDTEGRKTYIANICLTDAPIYLMEIEKDGSLTGGLISGALEIVSGSDDTTLSYNTSTKFVNNGLIRIAGSGLTSGTNVMVDYYIDLPSTKVYELDVTPEDFAGYYYVEADTLFRRQADGVDMPANITFPNVKIQSNMTLSLSSTGDPSTFDFTMDAFPGYTYFDKTKQVLCVIQFVDETIGGQSGGGDHPVMPHSTGLDDDVDYNNDSNTHISRNPKNGAVITNS